MVYKYNDEENRIYHTHYGQYIYSNNRGKIKQTVEPKYVWYMIHYMYSDCPDIHKQHLQVQVYLVLF